MLAYAQIILNRIKNGEKKVYRSKEYVGGGRPIRIPVVNSKFRKDHLELPQTIKWANVSGPPVGPVNSIADIVKVLKDHAAKFKLKQKELIIAYGYDVTNLSDGRECTHDDLDPHFPDNPVLLLHARRRVSRQRLYQALNAELSKEIADNNRMKLEKLGKVFKNDTPGYIETTREELMVKGLNYNFFLMDWAFEHSALLGSPSPPSISGTISNISKLIKRMKQPKLLRQEITNIYCEIVFPALTNSGANIWGNVEEETENSLPIIGKFSRMTNINVITRSMKHLCQKIKEL